MYVCMYKSMYVCLYVCMHVCMYSISLFLRVHNCKFVLRQDGAGEARWAHNPEVGRSKLSPAQSFYINL